LRALSGTIGNRLHIGGAGVARQDDVECVAERVDAHTLRATAAVNP
jgi:hypothetical protein